MVTNLQFAAVAGYLLWCLVASLTGAFDHTKAEDPTIIDESDKNVPVA